MTPDKFWISKSMQCSLQDEELYAAWCYNLPTREELTPFHSGPHSVQHFRTALQILGCPAPNILETGFCLGHSASILLGLGAHSVTSIDNSSRAQTVEARKMMEYRHDGAFTFILGDALKNRNALIDQLAGKAFNLMFVDGEHTEEYVYADIILGVTLGINVFLLDDYFKHWGPGVQPAMEKAMLKPIALLGTMCLASFEVSI